MNHLYFREISFRLVTVGEWYIYIYISFDLRHLYQSFALFKHITLKFLQDSFSPLQAVEIFR